MPRRSIRTERFDLGPGKCHVLSSPDSWSELPPALRRLVPRPMLDVWRGFPGSFTAMAQRARGRGFAAWLRACAKGEARLRVYETRDFGRSALLEVGTKAPALLDFRTPDTHTRRFPPSAPEQRRPKRVPPALREVHQAVGGVQRQLGASGSLIAPDALRPLPDLWPSGGAALDLSGVAIDPVAMRSEMTNALKQMKQDLSAAGADVGHMTDAWIREMVKSQAPIVESSLRHPVGAALDLRSWLAEALDAPSYARVSKMIPFYEENGDFLCFDSKGDTLWIGIETGGTQPFGKLDAALDAFFDCLRSGESFVARFDPSSG